MNELDLEKQLKQAQQFAMQGQEQNACMILLELLQEDPDNATALLMLGGSYFSLGKLQQAEMAFERLVLSVPGRGEYSIALFNCLWKQDRKDEALEEIRRFMNIADRNEEHETVTQYVKIIRQLSA